MSRQRILSISLSDFQHDARVLRQLRVLSEYGDVTTVGYGAPPTGAAEHLEVDAALPSLPQTPIGVLRLALRRFGAVELTAPAVASARRLIGDRRFDLVVANEARALPLAHVVAHGAPVWGDMHEWAPDERSDVLVWRALVAPFMRWICARYLPRTTEVTTVNRSIADLYDAQFGTRARVVTNARPLAALRPSPGRAGVIRLAHSGAAVPGRQIEMLIEATLQLGAGYTLDLYLVRAKDQGRYWDGLRDQAGGSPAITFHDAVTPEALPAALNTYDVGVFVLPPATINQRLMLPNKFFDFVQARLAIVFNSAPETDRLIHEYGVGLVTGTTLDELVATLASLTPTSIAAFKTRTDAAATSLSSEADEAEMRRLLGDLLAG